MSPKFQIAQLHGSSVASYGPAKPMVLGARAWRQQPIGLLVSGTTGTDVSTIDNSISVSEVEHRHT